ncbi:MAG: carbonic anhydrase [bacterium]|nr:carbonic anhydrase [bacterium]
MIPAQEALERLREGNRRFVANLDAPGDARPSPAAPHGTNLPAQNPFAIILGCSDARVPAELIFDQGLGDLFVIRVAGNIVAPSLVGSVEFAASRFETKLVVVLGHTRCGAIAATLEDLQDPYGHHSPNLRDIVDRIRPAVEMVVAENAHADAGDLALRAMRANIAYSVDHLRHDSPLMEQLIRDEGVLVIGAEYSLETGEVTFFDQD